jgi:cytochrome c553
MSMMGKRIRSLLFVGLAAAVMTAGAAVPKDLVEPLKACTACHGEDGNGAKASYPFLNWQNPRYLEEQMVGIQAGTQATNVPKHIPKELTRPQLAAIAKFYGEQRPPRDRPAFDPAKAAAGKAVFEQRCKECHADNGRDASKDVPVLAGQSAIYLFNQEKWYASGKRKYSPKADLAHDKMQEAERENVAHYLASQDHRPASEPGKRSKSP